MSEPGGNTTFASANDFDNGPRGKSDTDSSATNSSKE